MFPGTFRKHADHFYNFKARSDDIWIATYPRSGTTWTQELLWMIANDLDYEAAQKDFLTKRSPFFESVVQLTVLSYFLRCNECKFDFCLQILCIHA